MSWSAELAPIARTKTIQQIALILLSGLILVSLAYLWSYLPNETSRNGFLLMAVVSLVIVAKRIPAYTFLCVTFFSLAVAHRYQANHETSFLLILVVFLVVSATGLFFHLSHWPNPNHPETPDQTNNQPLQAVHYPILGLIAAQSVTLFSFWPISFFSRTVLSGVLFYLMWQLILKNPQTSVRAEAGHFVFITVTAIVVIGVILWANFPQLLGL